MKRIFYSICAALAIVLCSCSTVPETGRSSFNMMSDAEVNQMGFQEFENLKRSSKISTDKATANKISVIGKRIVSVARVNAPALPHPDQWEFVLFDDPQVNAFALPGGKIGVYTGMLKVATSDDELAIILGHEVGHVAAKHISERLSYELLKQGAAIGLAFGIKDASGSTQEAVQLAFGIGTQVGMTLPFSRQHEYEADRMGLIYSAKAGYNPQAGISLWKKMDALSGSGSTPEFLSTHPNCGNRIERLQQHMPEVMPFYNEAKSQIRK